MSGRVLPRSFYARPAHEVAPELLGRDLVRLVDGTRLVARIVETEAYGEDDPGSHAFGGRRTRRNATMFGPAGHLYVYFTYGRHWCVNVVTGRPGEGSAVLLRAALPLEGLPTMAAARGRSDPRDLCSGPAKLAQAFGIDGTLDGADVVRGPVRIAAGVPVDLAEVRTGPRIGLSRGTEIPWRFTTPRSGTPRAAGPPPPPP